MADRHSVELGRRVVREQAHALVALADGIDEPFAEAVEVVLRCRNQVVVTGIGKSGIIARKAAATLASTGTPAVFMHPVEGLHGDLGIVGRDSVLIALSKSGRTDEIVRFVGHFLRVGGRVIVVCEAGPCPLAEMAHVALPIPARPEAGPLALAPTTSTVMMLALCDALAMALLDARGFTAEQFARFHPDGALGRRLLLRAADLMKSGPDMPLVRADASFHDLLLEMTGKHLGMACVIHADGSLLGVFTDGDLRRLLTRCDAPGKLGAAEAWRQSRRDPNDPAVLASSVPPGELAVECLRLMRDSQITVLIVAKDGRKPVGVLRLHDLVAAGLG